MNEPFKQYIKAVGKGHKAGRYLELTEAEDAMTQMLNNQATAEQVGALLMLLRVREESVDELAGFLKAVRASVVPDVYAIDNVDLDLGCYAGKRRHLPWFILAVLVLAQHGYKVLLHGTAEPESKRLYLKDVFAELGWCEAQNACDIKRQLSTQGFSYIDLIKINPALDHLIQLRGVFGLRSCTNTLARMLNPTGAAFSLHGVFHREFDQRHAEIAALLNDPNVACIRGEGGEVEVNPERAFEMHISRHGIQTIDNFPVLLAHWQVKPRALSSNELVDFWAGHLQASYSDYGVAAVTGTLAVMLTLIESLPAEESLVKAQALWNSRDLDYLSCIEAV